MSVLSSLLLVNVAKYYTVEIETSNWCIKIKIWVFIVNSIVCRHVIKSP